VRSGADYAPAMPGIRAADVTIRPLAPEDAAAVAATARTSLEALYPEPEPTPEEEARRVASGTARVEHLQRTDPGGCWVADHDGRIVGLALGLTREGVWGLSLFAMLPEYQGLGIGNRLYAPTLEYGARERGGIILSSIHPAAMRRYARGPGFRLLPAISLSGAWNPSRVPAELRSRPGDLEADADTIEAASRHVRGASHLRDLPTLLARPDLRLVVIDGEGFACARDGTPWLVAAHSEAAAEDLLWGAITSGPRGGTVSIDFVTADNQWAIRVGLEAGLAVADWGAVFVRGDVGPMAPYLPSGAYL
jgi:GNAT superfamily N-acetyltransferase